MKRASLILFASPLPSGSYFVAKLGHEARAASFWEARLSRGSVGGRGGPTGLSDDCALRKYKLGAGEASTFYVY